MFGYIADHANVIYSEQIGEDLRGINAVQLTTIQQAKGLKWPIVFMPTLMSNRFPSKNTGKQKKVMIGRDLFDAERYEGSLEDERRLFYVAATRSKDALVFCSSMGAKKIYSRARSSQIFPKDRILSYRRMTCPHIRSPTRPILRIYRPSAPER